MIKRKVGKVAGYTLLSLPTIALWVLWVIIMGAVEGTIYFLSSIFIAAGIILCVYVGVRLVTD